jgi:predicted esterase
MIDPSSRKMPVFFGHGTADPLVKYNYGKRSYEFLQNTAPKSPLATDEDIQGLTWKEYPGMAHSCNEEEIQDLQAWLEKVLPPLEENTAST